MNETIDFFANVGGTLMAKPLFGGSTYQPEYDKARLTGQLLRVRDCMKDGAWRTLEEIKAVTGDPESSISARLRDLRKAAHGLYTVDRRRRTVGQYEYQMRGRGL